MTTENIEILRFTTAGSVDDGKSTLIGRLLYDSKSIFEDQLETLEQAADLSGGSEINLANLTDGLRSEREQGITIDVAYRYFATPKRKFIIADTPGHVQYTRNMVTGASTANLALILIDARKGVIEQSRRHAYIASLLRIPHVVACINKMDLVDFSEERYNEIVADFREVAARMDLPDVHFIPMSALKGDNVVNESVEMPWYKGRPLLTFLEEVYISSDRNMKDFRLPVQYVIRPHTDEHHDFRGFAGQVAGGIIKKGDPIISLPSGKRSKVKSIQTLDGELEEAFPPLCVSICLEDEIDCSRGDTLSTIENLPYVVNETEADICWMHETPMAKGRKYLIKHNANVSKMMIKEIEFKIDIETLDKMYDAESFALNDIGRIRLKTMKPLIFDAYKKNRNMGGFIIIDEATNATVAAGMLRSAPKDIPQPEYEGYMI